MTHREEKTFSITLHLSAAFADDYAGDEDGFVWHERFQHAVRPALVAAVHEALRAQPRFHAAAPRAHADPESALDLDVSFEPKPVCGAAS